MHNIALLISLVFHPMVVAPVAFSILIFSGEQNFSFKNKIFLISIFFSTVLSTGTVVYLRVLGKISDLDGKMRKERITPLVLGVIYYVFGFFLLLYLNAKPIVQGLMFCYALNTLVVLIVTFRWKISIHAIGLAGPLVALWLHGFQYPFVMISMLIALCYSRIFLKLHTPSQVLLGAFFAITFSYIQLKLFFL